MHFSFLIQHLQISCRAEIKFVCTCCYLLRCCILPLKRGRIQHMYVFSSEIVCILARDGNTCHIICFKRKNWLICLFNPELIFLQPDEFPISNITAVMYSFLNNPELILFMCNQSLKSRSLKLMKNGYYSREAFF